MSRTSLSYAAESQRTIEYGNLRQLIECPGGNTFTKSLAFAIQRSQKPLCITAFKFSVLSLKSFTAVIAKTVETECSIFACIKEGLISILSIRVDNCMYNLFEISSTIRVDPMRLRCILFAP